MAYLGEALYFKKKCREFESRLGYRQYSLTRSFRPPCDSGVGVAPSTNECQGCLLGNKGDRCAGLHSLTSL